MAKVDFNAKDVDPSPSFDVIGEGWYKAVLTKSDYRPTKAEDGHYISLQFKIIDGEHKGRMIFTNLNVDNPNPAAVEIAERNFSSLCHAVKVLIVQDTEQLHNIPLEIKVGITPPQGKYEARNDIKGYREIEGTPGFAEDESQETTTETKDTSGPESNTESDEMPAWLNEES